MYLLIISNVLVTSTWLLRSPCRGTVQLWITCSPPDHRVSFASGHVSRVMQRRHTHLLTPPAPLARLLRLLHLDQDVLLVCEVHHPPRKGPPHLELQQSVVPKVSQVHRCETRTLREKRHRLKSFSSVFFL